METPKKGPRDSKQNRQKGIEIGTAICTHRHNLNEAHFFLNWFEKRTSTIILYFKKIHG